MIDEQGKELKNSSWALDFHKAYSSLTSKNERASFLHNEDLLTRIATIWGASNANQTQFPNHFSELNTHDCIVVQTCP